MQNFPWITFIGWCIATGVPMTPIGGTWIGYMLLVIAGVVSLWRGYVWINKQNWQLPAIRLMVAIPTVLLFIMAIAWSYYGVLPILQASEPATYVELKDAVPVYEVFQPADTTKINAVIKNKGPLLAKDVTWAADLAIRYPSITDLQESEMFDDVLKSHKGTPKMDLGVGNETFKTIQTPMLSKKEAEDLQSGNTRLYLIGFVHYRDKNGQQIHEFCRWLQPPKKELPSVWHFCEGGHNRTFKE